MFPIYLKIAIRNLLKDRSFSLINIAGLTIGLATSGLILLWVQNELSFNQYHNEPEKIFRINCHVKVGPDEIWHWSSSPLKLRDFVPGQIPEVRKMAQMYAQGNLTFRIGQEYFQEKKAVFVSEDWFRIFKYKFLEGSPASFFSGLRNIILTSSAAKKYFGKKPPVGAVISMNDLDYTVAAVIEDARPNSSFNFDCILSLASRLANPKVLEEDNNFNNFNYQAFVLLNSPASVNKVNAKLNGILNTNKEENNVKTTLQNITDIRFDQEIEDDGFVHQDRQTVHIFALIGMITLLAACINYVNLSTARAGNRTKEVGIKKVIGASSLQVFTQLMFETALMSLTALIVAVFLMHLFLDQINTLADTRIPMDFSQPGLWMMLGGATIMSILIAGIYPALLLSGIKPVSLIKSRFTPNFGKSGLRKVLVVLQFVVSIVLIICTLIISAQLNYIKNKNPGYHREQVLEIQPQIHYNDAVLAQKELNSLHLLVDELKSLSQVSAAALTSQSPISINSTHQGSLDWKGKDPDFKPTVTTLNTDPELISVFGLEMAAGRWFRADIPFDQKCFIFNETAVRNFNIPEPVVGREVSMVGDTGVILGVVKDFHFKNMHEKIQPAIISNRERGRSCIVLKIKEGNTAGILAAIETSWEKYFPDQPFQYTFQDDAFDKMHRKDAIMGLLFRFFASILIFISCLGLLGLVAYAVERRTKEIGVRKVLGAGVWSVVALISKDFIQLVLLSLVIASPIAWYSMELWLNNFAYRIAIPWWIFLLAGFVAILLALITISFQSIKAAMSNPVKSLRSE